jgi:acyl transferase domain-containing protein/NAD(P)H-dependent flavin oxidoreductase YrpB (nitropropane dioxygenase family)/NAD(P)-dependent dehydrogenase (short-subunit alcohol dehydrogenase family)
MSKSVSKTRDIDRPRQNKLFYSLTFRRDFMQKIRVSEMRATSAFVNQNSEIRKVVKSMMYKSVIGMSPFETPDVGLVEALASAGAIGILDLGRQANAGHEALASLHARGLSSFGVRIPDLKVYSDIVLPEAVSHLILDAADLLASNLAIKPWRNRGRQIWVQVCSLAEAKALLATDRSLDERPDGLIVKGSESGGRIGSSSSYILLQEIKLLNIPFWVQGGIGMHSSAAAILAGAEGVLLDSQLALFRESNVDADIKKAVEHTEGTETRVIHGHQVFTRPDLRLPHDSEIALEDFKARLGALSLKGNFLPLGQDICFAKSLAERHRSIRTFVHSLKRSMKGHLRQAKAHLALAEGSAMAKALGTEYPIAQGPMTRVSDRAEFINAVSDTGAMPFLALSLMGKNDCRKLLNETAELLGDKPWGVGILGFVAEELHKDQLEVLADFNPKAMLIAGGRPSQAQHFEKRGIKTFLHVPSPGLLKQFLKDGARRFVFEGRECGGHVGPRSSFVLWDTQIEILLQSDSIHELEIFFAGGVHDGFSAALVAAMAAPLSARGAKVGALIGTAYLFTEEAVTSGAILKRFQDEALRCEETALLETAPGHATRCAMTPFVDSFQAKKEELRSQSVDPKAIWAELEGLNVGRLRVASKGIERVGSELVTVAEDRQLGEGMYMLGQVAQMRNQVIGMRELHDNIAQGSSEILKGFDVAAEAATASADVAIIGMACIFPGAKDLGAYWKNILIGADLVTEVPDSRWNKEAYFTTKIGEPNKSISKWGSFIDPIEFDPLEFGIPPNSMAAIEPTQLLSLKVAKKALDDAGYATRSFDRERTSVIFGAEAGNDLGSAYSFRAQFPQFAGPLPAGLDEFLPSLTEDSFPGVLANVISGRIANRLDFGGSNYTVDAACGSSLAALDLGVKELTGGESDMVLVGGADLHNSITDYLMFSSVKALSPTGKSRPFSAEADGIVLAEGIAVVVMKRLKDAIRDNDRVYAVVKSVGSSSDGKSLGLTAPRKEGQMRALHRAYERAGVSPAEIELVEAHGTGTVVGDRTEMETLGEVFSEAGALNRSCALGSVKSQIGHSKCAAGLAGVIKSSLAIYHGIIPPTINIAKPNPGYKAKSSPFFFSPIAVPWTSKSRKAGVSAFGFGGTNFHTVLVSHDAKVQTEVPSIALHPAELFLFQSKEQLLLIKEALKRSNDIDIARLAKTIALAGSGPVFAAIVAKDASDLSTKIDQALEGKSCKAVHLGSGKAASGKVAVLFSGQGSQSLNMGAEIFNSFPELRQYLAIGEKWLPAIFPKGADETSEETLKQTRNTQPALGIIDMAFYHLLQSFGIKADMLGGHSYGELVALCAAGSISAKELLELSEARATAIETAAIGTVGSMAAVTANLEAVTAAIQGLDVSVANHNSPTQVVISGATAAIEAAIIYLKALGINAKKIPVSCAFHSPLLSKAEGLFAEALSKVDLKSPDRAIYSNTTAKVHDAADLKAAYARQIVKPVKFVEQIETMHADGARIFLEVGPGAVLKGLVERILDGEPQITRSMGRAGNSLEQFLSLIAELASLGLEVKTDVLYANRNIETYDLVKLSKHESSKTIWLVNGHFSEPKFGAIPKGGLKPGAYSLNMSSFGSNDRGNAADSGLHTRESVVKDYLQSMRQLVDSQKQVMLQFLGSDQIQASSGQSQSYAAPAQRVEVRAAAPLAVQAIAEAAVAPVATVKAALDIAATVLSVVSQKTGYPSDMLDLDSDLEADLSIDSIKRFEILADLGERLGDSLSESRGALEKLSWIKTLRQLINALDAQIKTEAPAAASSSPSPSPSPAPVKVEQVAPDAGAPSDHSEATTPEIANDLVSQYLFRIEEALLPANGAQDFNGKSFTLLEDKKGVAKSLAKLLEAEGAQVKVIAASDSDLPEHETADGLILISLLDEEGSHPTEVFKTVQHACRKNVHSIIAVTGRGGTFGHTGATSSSDSSRGISGLFKSLAKEYSEKLVKIIDLDLHDSADRLAAHILAELKAADPLVEIGYQGGIRRQIVAVPLITDFGAEKLSLDRNSVVLMLGGARGIAAQVATKLAEQYGCRFEIVGRTPMVEIEDASTAGISDIQSLRAHFIKAKIFKKPSEIEGECRRILNDREMRETFERLEAAGSRTRYHCFDVRNKAKLTALIDELYANGRIDGVIHAAGVLRDSLILEKSAESFNLVFETKVNPAEVLEAKLQSDVKFVALFSSVSGCFGNRGQTDYAAANNALDHVARSLGKKVKGRTLSINWGPWGGTGMVTPELENEYKRQGIGLIPPSVGSQRFLDELRFGDHSTRQVVIMSGSPESFGYS